MATHQFQVDTNIIQHLIASQAGSLEKALLECYMNSVDAGASSVSIDLDSRGEYVVIRDDGRGWQSEAEINATFGTFGFEHSDDSRTYGQFGLGRGQLWNYCAVDYHTNEFTLSVDIRNRGLDYDVTRAEAPTPGCCIEGRFYEPLDPRDRDTTLRNLKEWLAWGSVVVTLNGETISRDPAESDWDKVTDLAYFKFKEQSTLLLYNQGVFIGRISAHEYGTGGIVVSRKPMALNMARNDVLRGQCPVWPHIRDTLRDHSGRKVKQSTKRINDASRAFHVREWLAGDIEFNAIEKLTLLVDARGRGRKLNAVKSFRRVAIADVRGSAVADRSIATRSALVLAPEVAEWFDVKDAAELKDRIITHLNDEIAGYASFYGIGCLNEIKRFWESVEAVEWATIQGEADHEHYMLDPKELAPKQKARLSAAKTVNEYVSSQLMRVRHELLDRRELIPGRSSTAEAWTDGSSFIGINVKLLKMSFSGAGNLARLARVLVHEYTHDDSSMDDTHTHSPAFHESFHNALMHPLWDERKITDYAMRAYENALNKEGLKVPRWVSTQGRILDDESANPDSNASVDTPSSDDKTAVAASVTY